MIDGRKAIMDIGLKTSATNIPLVGIAKLGSNYIRYTNGLQICFERITIPHVSLTANTYTMCRDIITFPVSFSDKPIVSCIRIGFYDDTEPDSNIGLSYQYIEISDIAVSTTHASAAFKSNKNINDSFTLAYIAIGYWK